MVRSPSSYPTTDDQVGRDTLHACSSVGMGSPRGSELPGGEGGLLSSLATAAVVAAVEDSARVMRMRDGLDCNASYWLSSKKGAMDPASL